MGEIEQSAILQAAGVLVLAAAVASALYVLIVKPGKKLSQIAEKFGQFWDDWNGVEDRPGVPGRSGVMVRIESIEEQLKPNHGTSLRDAVNRTESGVRRVEDALAAHLLEHRLAAAQQKVVINTAVTADVVRADDEDNSTRGES